METTQENKVKVGDLFYTSWGYDQTNYNFLKVISVSKTGKTVKAKMASATTEGTESYHNLLKPNGETFGDIFQMKVTTGYRGGLVLRGSYPYHHDGKIEVREYGGERYKAGMRLDTFYPVEENRTYAETMAGFGH